MLVQRDQNREPEAHRPNAERQPTEFTGAAESTSPMMDELVTEAVTDMVRELRASNQLDAASAAAYLAKAMLHPAPVRADEHAWIDRLSSVAGLASEDWTIAQTCDLLDRIYLGQPMARPMTNPNRGDAR